MVSAGTPLSVLLQLVFCALAVANTDESRPDSFVSRHRLQSGFEANSGRRGLLMAGVSDGQAMDFFGDESCADVASTISSSRHNRIQKHSGGKVSLPFPTKRRGSDLCITKEHPKILIGGTVMFNTGSQCVLPPTKPNGRSPCCRLFLWQANAKGDFHSDCSMKMHIHKHGVYYYQTNTPGDSAASGWTNDPEPHILYDIRCSGCKANPLFDHKKQFQVTNKFYLNACGPPKCPGDSRHHASKGLLQGVESYKYNIVLPAKTYKPSGKPVPPELNPPQTGPVKPQQPQTTPDPPKQPTGAPVTSDLTTYYKKSPPSCPGPVLVENGVHKRRTVKHPVSGAKINLQYKTLGRGSSNKLQCLRDGAQINFGGTVMFNTGNQCILPPLKKSKRPCCRIYAWMANKDGNLEDGCSFKMHIKKDGVYHITANLPGSTLSTGWGSDALPHINFDFECSSCAPKTVYNGNAYSFEGKVYLCENAGMCNGLPAVHTAVKQAAQVNGKDTYVYDLVLPIEKADGTFPEHPSTQQPPKTPPKPTSPPKVPPKTNPKPSTSDMEAYFSTQAGSCPGKVAARLKAGKAKTTLNVPDSQATRNYYKNNNVAVTNGKISLDFAEMQPGGKYCHDTGAPEAVMGGTLLFAKNNKCYLPPTDSKGEPCCTLWAWQPNAGGYYDDNCSMRMPIGKSGVYYFFTEVPGNEQTVGWGADPAPHVHYDLQCSGCKAQDSPFGGNFRFWNKFYPEGVCTNTAKCGKAGDEHRASKKETVDGVVRYTYHMVIEA